MSQHNQTSATRSQSIGASFHVGQTVRFVSSKGYTRVGGELAAIDQHFPAASNGGTDYWRVNLHADAESPEGRSYCATADELHEVRS